MSHLLELGFTDRFAAAFRALGDPLLEPARVVAEHGEFYSVALEDAELLANARKSLRFAAATRVDLPAVGDFVAVLARRGEGRATIQHLLPRASALVRKAAGRREEPQVLAANLDTVFVVGALNRELNLRRIERLVALVAEGGARPAVILNKADLAVDAPGTLAATRRIVPGVAVHAVSAWTGHGLEELGPYLGRSATVALVGSSGVGKSSLVNRLVGAAPLAVGEARASDDRGRHTTTHREIVLLPSGGALLDTPGLREVGVWDLEHGLDAVFSDVEALTGACRFTDCAHASEPGCAVRDAARRGLLEPDRLAAWDKLRREASAARVRADGAARAAERKRLRVMHRAHRMRDRLRGRDDR